MRILEVGGSIRDELLGLKSKDKDFTVVMKEFDLIQAPFSYPAGQHQLILEQNPEKGSMSHYFQSMCYHLHRIGYKIFLVSESILTVRAKFPEDHEFKGWTADFVLARKETGYLPGTRQPIVVPGTIEDDVYRRDFCCNTLFRDEEGKIVDLTGKGISDIESKTLSCPLYPYISFEDDPLRIMRAIRFSVTKGFKIGKDVRSVMLHETFDLEKVSAERWREELQRCFKHSTTNTIFTLVQFPKIYEYIFSLPDLWLKPTFEK